MKNKGFTLIELLAVIVILAIIALIAVPIIMNIINDARESGNKRSVELYGKAVANAIAKSQLNNNPIPAGDYISSSNGETLTQDVEDDNPAVIAVDYEGSRVSCTTNKVFLSGKIYLDGCTVGTGTKTYTYGVDEDSNSSTQVYVPTYRSWDSIGKIGDNAPANPTSARPAGKTYYVGYDVTNGKISAGYVCFVRNEQEYCLKGNDETAYGTNKDIMAEAFADDPDADCSSSFTECELEDFQVHVTSNGYVNVYDGTYRCWVYPEEDDYDIECFED